jgi:hypothetical protein
LCHPQIIWFALLPLYIKELDSIGAYKDWHICQVNQAVLLYLRTNGSPQGDSPTVNWWRWNYPVEAGSLCPHRESHLSSFRAWPQHGMKQSRLKLDLIKSILKPEHPSMISSFSN